MSADEEQKDHDIAIVKRATADLMKHFDSVQIFVQRYEPGNDHGTLGFAYGKGNWYSRIGHIGEWLRYRNEGWEEDEETEE